MYTPKIREKSHFIQIIGETKFSMIWWLNYYNKIQLSDFKQLNRHCSTRGFKHSEKFLNHVYNNSTILISCYLKFCLSSLMFFFSFYILKFSFQKSIKKMQEEEKAHPVEGQKMQILPTTHQQIIQDLSFNLSGNRLVTSSPEGKLTFFQQINNGQWIKQAEQETNEFIGKIKWAHPYHGNIVAICTLNKNILLYEQILDNDATEGCAYTYRFQEYAIRGDVQDSLIDIKFAPQHTGLVLAAASLDGNVYIFQFNDRARLDNYDQPIVLQASINSLSSLTFSKTQVQTDFTYIAIGCKEDEFRVSNRNTVLQNISDQMDQYGDENIQMFLKDYYDEIKMKRAKLQEDKQQKIPSKMIFYQWKKEKIFERLPDLITSNKTYESLAHQTSINDISWADSCGRNFNLIATCGNDGIRVWIFNINQALSIPEIEIIDVINTDSPPTPYSRICWNSNSTIISASLKFNSVIEIYKLQQNKYLNLVQTVSESEQY